MNDKQYVCEIHPFTKDQICYVGDSNGFEVAGVVTMESLGSFLTSSCYSNGINKIHLVGPASYINRICEDIKYEESCHYGLNKIEIEVN